ncbi:MAG: hypothetical protein SOV71_06065 [Anaerovoracaceae bacterium]|nr:hypothetical protein [Bacillota bacterium]MDY2671103.1 hypothetical protein [Anaerovoracaceae bacterium]
MNEEKENIVYRLRFDLVVDPMYRIKNQFNDLNMPAEQYREFLELAKAERGISRTVLVPGDLTLHSMHYMIQQLFGWRNSHLHCFSLDQKLFEKLTGDQIGGWLDLCGVLLRFPVEDNADVYWDDDYKPDKNFKTWLRQKYRRHYDNKIVAESFMYTLGEVRDFENRLLSPQVLNMGKKKKYLKRSDTLKDLHNTVIIEQGLNTLLERLRVEDLFHGLNDGNVKAEEWKRSALEGRSLAADKVDEMRSDPKTAKNMDHAMHELLYWRELYDNVDMALYYGDGERIRKQLRKDPEVVLMDAVSAMPHWEKKTFRLISPLDPQIEPLLSTLYYQYDYGDNWWLRIICERTEEADPEAKYPLCVASDGLSLLDDVGGITGYYDMLKTLAGRASEDRDSTRRWAKGMGWTGRKKKPENML